VQGALIVGLHVPAWAASLGVAMVMFAWSSRQAAVTMTAGYDPAPHAYYWFGGFCALSITASLVGLIPPVRRAFGRFRPVADPALRRGWIAGTNTLAAIVAASILAGVAGVLWVSSAGAAEASGGFELTALAIGAALLGGTSAYGRRGGIFGTVFAVALLAVLARYALQVGWGWSDALLGAAAIGVGLVVTRLVEPSLRHCRRRNCASAHSHSPRGGATSGSSGTCSATCHMPMMPSPSTPRWVRSVRQSPTPSRCGGR
jgi:ribose/xylose/arabinose/galactoside ABC-type transport system permease subunit